MLLYKKSDYPSFPYQLSDEIEIIKSGMILDKTISDLRLDIRIIPTGFFHKYLYDTSSVDIDLFILPERQVGQIFNLTFLGGDRYSLNVDGLILKGTVGEVLKKGELCLLVSSFQAKKGEEFSLVKKSHYLTIENLRNNLTITEAGKDSGIIRLAIKGLDKDENVKVLNSIIQNYIAQDIERKKELTTKKLEFLDDYLSDIKGKIDDNEDRLTIFRKKSESIDIPLEMKSAIDRQSQIENKLNELTLKEVETKKLFTPKHPEYQSLLNKRQQLLHEKESINKAIQDLPDIQKEIDYLTRDSESERAFYRTLVAKQQELRVLDSEVDTAIHIINPADSQPDPIAPKKLLVVALVTITSFIIICAYVVIRELFNNKIKNAEDIEALGVNIYANIPLSTYKKGLVPQRDMPPLAIINPEDIAIESIRVLRTKVHSSVMSQNNNLVMISSASSEVGINFVTSNMAVLFANAGKKVLLIDANLRNGCLHKPFGLNSQISLYEYLSQKDIEFPTVHTDVIDNLDVICHSKNARHSSELLMSDRFKQLLEKVKNQYDIVILGSPPILAITDSAIIGRYVGTSLLVGLCGVNTVKDIESSLKLFKQYNIETTGIILNGIVNLAT